MRKFWTKPGWRDVFFLLIILKLLYWILRCCSRKKRKTDYFQAEVIRNQLIVLKKDDVTAEEFERWKTRNLRVRNIRFLKVCGNCDDSLELWEGDNVPAFISGGGKLASGGSSSGDSGVQGGGEDEVAFYSYNIVIDLPEPEPDECELGRYRFGETRPGEQQGSEEAPIVVAVFDTGLLPELKNTHTQAIPENCISNGDKGWNFVDKSANTADDNGMRHGSIVTKFILDQADKYNKRRVNILPVKVHNQDGKGDLFSVLCAFAYAANCGAKIINASFGFYAQQKSEAPSLLREFVKKHIAGNNILLVAAAGNANLEADSDFLSHTRQNPRNLEEHPFYPACLSKEFSNVITVTTVSVTKPKATASPDQNFSNKAVNIGVNCDLVEKGNYAFLHPFKNNTAIYGSSFATPIVTGILSQFYNELIAVMPGGQFDSDRLIHELDVLGLADGDARLESFIKDGSFCKK